MQESTAKTATEWVFVARSVAQLPGGQDQALRCMARAGIVAQDVADWLAVAKAWAQDFSDEEMAQQCLGRAELLAEKLDEWEKIAWAWETIAKIWKEHFEDIDNSVRCMKKAEEFAEDSDEWVYIAKVWKDSFHDSDSVSRCMEVVESSAEDTGDWLRIAKMWKEELQDLNEAIRCMEQAEEVADYFEDYSALEETWREDFQDVDRDIVRSAIQRLVDTADAEFGLTEIVNLAFGDQGSNQVTLASETAVSEAGEAPVSITDLGYLAPGAIFVQTGIWSRECYSAHRPDCYARYYVFKVAMLVGVQIDLSSEIDAYLYLLDADGNVLEENDDWQNGTDSRISRHLSTGTYTIEATTFDEEESGEFSLAINT